MSRIAWIICAAVLVVMPHTAHAIQLHWYDNSTSLTFESSRTCTLVVEDSGGLPSEWRLAWVVNGCTVRALAPETPTSWQGDIAYACEVAWPASQAERLANQTTTQFCSDGEARATRATIQLTITAGRGKFQAFALRDSATIERSEEVTFNGGSSDEYPPLIVGTNSNHGESQVHVSAVGVNLGALQEVFLASPDTSWRVSLAIASRTDTTLDAVGDVSARLPAAVIRGQGPTSVAAVADIPADEVMEPQAVGPLATMVDASGYIRPKDFSILYDGLGKFHIFYMRENTNQADATLNTKKVCHVTTSDWVNYSAQDTSFDITSNAWEHGHIWAPHVFQRGPTTYMFYAGVDDAYNQSIGLASTNNINAPLSTWSRRATPIFTKSNALWVNQSGVIDLRDPFVMVDSVQSASTVLLFYTTEYGDTSTATEKYVVGVAQATDTTLTSWINVGPMRITDWWENSTALAESPHAFFHVTKDGSGAPVDTSWYLAFTYSLGGGIMMERHKHHVMDLTQTYAPSAWNLVRTQLRNYLPASQNTLGTLSASEYFRFGNHEYLGAYDASSIRVAELEWLAVGGGRPDTFQLRSSVAAVVNPPSRRAPSVGLRVLNMQPGRSAFQFRIDASEGMRGRLCIFDVGGRRLRALMDGKVAAGSTDITWDGKDREGNSVRSGMYFALLETKVARRLARIPVVR